MTDPKIIYENDDVLVIDKPAGILVHGDGVREEPTIADWLVKNYPDLAGVGEIQLIKGVEVKRPGIVHRLDKDTSGVMIIAKSQPAYEWLKEQFRSHEARKKYLALVAGELKLKPGEMVGTINVPIGRSRQDARLRVAHPRAAGKQREALTRFRVLKTLTDQTGKQIFTLVEAFPETGRTHQIRSHFKNLNHPIVGDQLYAPNYPAPKPLERMALHAGELEIVLPSKEKRSFTSPLPADITDALANLREV